MGPPANRDDFPLLRRRIDGRPVIYLDSAATSLRPVRVMEAEARFATDFTGNIHRGSHALAEEATTAFEAARRRIGRFVGVEPARAIMVRGATEGINVVARGLRLGKDDKVLVPTNEHHANIVPWMALASVHWLRADPCSPLRPDAVEAALREVRPRVLAVSMVSNVTGVINPVREICALAARYGVLTCVDASQAVSHLPIRVDELGCDFITFSGHKCLGPTGTGVLTGRADQLERLEPLVFGGGAVDRVTSDGYALKRLPHRHEAGTPNISGVLGLAAALDYLEELGFATIRRHDALLLHELAGHLRDVEGFRILGGPAQQSICLVSLIPTRPGISAETIAVHLSDTYGIMVRAGFHCAHPLFDGLGEQGGALRVSSHVYTTAGEIAAFASALKETARAFRL